MKIRLTETQRNCLRFGYTIGHGAVAVARADTLTKLVRLRLIVADEDGKGGRLTAQGTSVALTLVDDPNRTTFDIMAPAEFDQWEAEQQSADADPSVKASPSLSFLGGEPPKRHTGAERHPSGKNLPDDSDLSQASTDALIVSLCTTLDGMTRTNNVTSLAVLGSYAGRLWWEMAGRGVEFA
ncbi:hypothetical protein [Streptomyces reticuliscabiei]|uniref:hypothetical protein n=1 Tax=Streptomyces reticuliscabiei TaxID=146821 RepID=UPI000A36ECEA|nr:hypothetical protein [Streptomyces reticuliscabiei]